MCVFSFVSRKGGYRSMMIRVADMGRQSKDYRCVDDVLKVKNVVMCQYTKAGSFTGCCTCSSSSAQEALMQRR